MAGAWQMVAGLRVVELLALPAVAVLHVVEPMAMAGGRGGAGRRAAGIAGSSPAG